MQPISRRRLLATGTAVAGAGAIAVTHPFGIGRGVAAPPAQPTPWLSPLHTPAGRSTHLLRRAGFGYSTADLDVAAQMSYGDLVESVLSQQPVSPTYPDAASRCGRWNAGPVWLRHMATTPAQFPERMALFWHGLLASGDDKQPFEFDYMVVQNEMFRRYGLSDLRTLLLQTSLSAAMMSYLDLAQNTVGNPNENYARELMELFTMGPGNYTEADVREAARALTGYRITAFDGSGAERPWPHWGPTEDAYVARIHSLIGAGWTWRGTLDPSFHDAGSKTFLGRTGNLALEDVVDAILTRPATATFIARKAVQHFVGDFAVGDTAFVTELANRFRQSGHDIRTLMRCIFLGADFLAHTDPARNRFLAAPAYRAIVRHPVDMVIAAIRATGYTQWVDGNAYWTCGQMGMSPYEPPNVSGWWHGSAMWAGTTQWLARLNFAGDLSWRSGHPELNPDPDANLVSQLDGVISSSTQAAYRGAWSGDRWRVLLGSPEFNLK
jgi:uncharacterized protein (DUF1800 family)